jgi:hypothetical protein
MPDAFNQPTALAPKQINRTAKRVLTKGLLHQRSQAIHAAAHIRMATGKENPRPSRRTHHCRARTAKTRPKAALSTAASTLINAPPGRAISITPVGEIASAGAGLGSGADNRTSAKSALANSDLQPHGVARDSMALRHV